MRVDGALVCLSCTGRLVGKISHQREQLGGEVSVSGEGKSRAGGGREGGATNELRAGICCHVSGFEESNSGCSHGYAGA